VIPVQDERLQKANLRRILKGRLSRNAINLRKIKNRKVTHREVYEWIEVKLGKTITHKPIKMIGLTQAGVELRQAYVRLLERKKLNASL
jgi:hypothetical protein